MFCFKGMFGKHALKPILTVLFKGKKWVLKNRKI